MADRVRWAVQRLIGDGPCAAASHKHLFESKKSVGVVFLHACARTDHSLSEIIIFKSAAGSISFRSTVSQSCSIHACVGGPPPGYDGDADGWLVPAPCD